VSEPDRPDEHDDRDRRMPAFAVEAVIGLAIALLLMWVAIASTTDVPFVYQGL
jgi:hypothetical protein